MCMPSYQSEKVKYTYMHTYVHNTNLWLIANSKVIYVHILLKIVRNPVSIVQIFLISSDLL